MRDAEKKGDTEGKERRLTASKKIGVRKATVVKARKKTHGEAGLKNQGGEQKGESECPDEGGRARLHIGNYFRRALGGAKDMGRGIEGGTTQTSDKGGSEKKPVPQKF